MARTFSGTPFLLLFLLPLPPPPPPQAADVGVGLLGREGRQAANNSDVALPAFRHLVPLLLVHGQVRAAGGGRGRYSRYFSTPPFKSHRHA